MKFRNELKVLPLSKGPSEQKCFYRIERKRRIKTSVTGSNTGGEKKKEGTYMIRLRKIWNE
jgi:hypothetical protein